MQNTIPLKNLRINGQLEMLTIDVLYELRPLFGKDWNMQLTLGVMHPQLTLGVMHPIRSSHMYVTLVHKNFMLAC